MSDRLLEMLLLAGEISAADAARARARQQEAGGAIDTALLELGLVAEERMLPTLARAAELPPAPPEAFADPDPRARRVFPAKVAERHGIAPFAMEGRDLSVVTSHPPDLGLLDEISFMLSLHLRPHVAPEWRVRALVRDLYGIPAPERLAALEARLRSGAAAEPGKVELPPPSPAPEGAPPALPEPVPPTAPETAREAPPVAPTPIPAPRATTSPRPPSPRARRDEPGFSAPPPRPVPSRPVPPPVQGPQAKPARWTLDQARQALGSARDRDAVIEVALRNAHEFFEYAAVLVVGRDRLVGYDARGGDDPDARAACRRVSVPLAAPGLFRTPIETRAPYLGPPTTDDATREILAGLGRGSPRTVLLHPVFIRDRPVCVVYADNGDAPVSAGRLGDLFVLLGSVGPALERVILARKGRPGAPPPSSPSRTTPRPETPRSTPIPDAAGDGDRWTVQEPAWAADPFLDDLFVPVEVDLGDFEVASASEALSQARVIEVAATVSRLAASERGSPERAGLLAAVARQGSVAARELVARLPGPVEVDDPLATRTPVEEQGPLLAALAALGAPALPALQGALDAPDPVRRRLAVLLLGRLGDASVLPHLAIRALDDDPKVAAAAREVLAGLRWYPEMESTVEWLRSELGSSSHARADQAALALARIGQEDGAPRPSSGAAGV